MWKTIMRGIKHAIVGLICGQILGFAACKPPESQARESPVPEYAKTERERREKEEEEEEMNTTTGSATALPKPGRVEASTARQLVSRGAVLVDVRTPREYHNGHIEGSINIPLGELSSRMDDVRELGEPLVVYCRSGSRSAMALGLLQREGVRHVYDLGAKSNW